jgi:hypothetical protein
LIAPAPWLIAFPFSAADCGFTILLATGTWETTVKTFATAFLPLFAIGLAMPAIAQENPSSGPAAPAARASAAKAGDTVYDKSGEVVGTVESIEGQNAVISTATGKATIPVGALTSGSKGPMIAMTKAQLEARQNAAKGPTP